MFRKKQNHFRISFFTNYLSFRKLISLFSFVFVFSFLAYIFLSFNISTVQASPAFFSQVKTQDSSTVYFLSKKNHLKKIYINAPAYLSYGNHWSDIKIVSSSYLATWPVAKLVRGVGQAQIYYIQGSSKALIASPADLIRFNLAGEPILELSLLDLAQYQTLSPSDLGLGGLSSTPPPPSSEFKINIENELVSGQNNNSLVPGTKNNLIAAFRLSSPQLATITSLSLDLRGIYNSQVVKDFSLEDEAGNDYNANLNWRSSDHRLVINFPQGLCLESEELKLFKILVDLNTCADCHNQTLYLSLSGADKIEASLPISASWPLYGTSFKLVSNANILGEVQAQMLSLDANDLVPSSGRRLLAKLNLEELSGQEDVQIKKLVFKNQGSANDRDINNFELVKDGQVIARTSEFNAERQIVFNINYLLIPKSSQSTLSVVANLLSDYRPQNTYNLELKDLEVQGLTYNLSLNPSINNLSQSFNLN